MAQPAQPNWVESATDDDADNSSAGGKDNDMALEYHPTHEPLVRQQEAQDMATLSHNRPTLKRIEKLSGQESSSVYAEDNMMARHITSLESPRRIMMERRRGGAMAVIVMLTVVMMMMIVKIKPLLPIIQQTDVYFVVSQHAKSSYHTTTSLLTTDDNPARIVPTDQQNGSWIGNHWMPPTGWHLYTPSQLRAFYSHRHVLWVGDSTARRAAMSMYAILNSTQDALSVQSLDANAVVDVNKKQKVEFCERWVGEKHQPDICRLLLANATSTNFAYLRRDCPTGLEGFLRDELAGTSNITDDFDTVIVAQGIWEIVRPWDCRDSGENPRSVEQKQRDVIQLLWELRKQKPVDIVWRTFGYTDVKDKVERTEQVNEHAIRTIENVRLQHAKEASSGSLSVVHWAGAMRPRALGADRIKGDMEPHWGLEARHVLIQMITNQLASL